MLKNEVQFLSQTIYNGNLKKKNNGVFKHCLFPRMIKEFNYFNEFSFKLCSIIVDII